MKLNIEKLKALAASGLLVFSVMPQSLAQTAAQTAAPVQQTAVGPSGAKNSAGMGIGDFPAVPQPNLTVPSNLRDQAHNYASPKWALPNPFAPYTSTNVPPPEFNNTRTLDQLIRDGKIYLSLADAIKLALANNYDIAIQRYNLDIADTDILRAKAGSNLRGVNANVVQGTIGGAQSTQLSGGGPGGTSLAQGGSASGASGLVLSTNGGGPTPEYRDPVLSGQTQLQRQTTAITSAFSGSSTNTDFYNFGYTQGFSPGAQLAVTFDNQRQTNNSPFNTFSPALTSSFQATLTQHLLQGRGFFINNRFIVQAKRDRQITDSAFRQQVLSTVNQVENIYWGLVSAYEDVQAKQRALEQSQRLAADNRKQLQIGTLAPLDVTNADSAVATDQQSLVNSQTTLEYQQLVMKQAIARNLEDPTLATAPVVPTDRVSLDKLEEESSPVETLVQQAYQSRPEIEQAELNLKNAELTVKAIKNGLLPQVDVYGFYGAATAGGAQNPACETFDPNTGAIIPCPAGTVPTINYTNVFQNLFNSSNPDKGAGVNVNITLRNRVAQADQERSQLEFRQAQLRLAQLYTQIRIQVINAQYALTQDRASVQASQAAREYQGKSLSAENEKYRLGASTTQLVLQQKRNVAAAEANYITAVTTYARDRASLEQILANTLEKYGIDLADTASGAVTKQPVVPGLVPAENTEPTQSQQQQAPGN